MRDCKYRSTGKAAHRTRLFPKREQVFLCFGHKKVSPRRKAGAKKGLRRKGCGAMRGALERTYREKCSPVQGRKRYVSPKAPRHSISQEKERVFVCPYYIGAGRKKKYSVGIQPQICALSNPETAPESVWRTKQYNLLRNY